MSIIFGFLIFIAIISTAVLFGFAMHAHWMDKDDSASFWKPVIILLTVSGVLMINRALTIEGATINEAFLILWVLVSIAMFISMASSRFYNLKYKQKGKFSKITRNSFIVGFILFLLFIFTMPGTNVEEGAAAVESETVKTAKEISEDNEAGSDAEKQAEEERLAAEKAKEEQAQAEKEEQAEREAQEQKEKEQAEKEKQEKLAAEKEAEEKAEVEKQAEAESSAIDGLTAVELYRVVDGDTVHVIDSDNNMLKLRLLLIDTPETVHPNKPVEAFGPEASSRMTELMNSAEELHIEYDEGAQTDHYGRHLVYLYADGVSVHEVLLEEGLARVGYIYEQQRYLADFREKEQYAKNNQLGIWSIPGYVNEGGEGFNSEEEEETLVETAPESNANPVTAPESGGSYNFANCTELKTEFPDGVASDHPAYQSKMDRDKDNWACES
ncbi:thermonuclease family protein [Jeotgalicoccus psychrophilus]|uniref:thermonuclease family protein n=1 Tax=Jeotgalicoccus psychrophilus TaxID=157228 RepID=UPI000403499D|nr:thermonuclease family protein [Jeotgalicoccus psychrophilus]